MQERTNTKVFVRVEMMNVLTQVWLGHGGIKRSIAHFLYGMPRWKVEEGKTFNGEERKPFH